MPIRFRTLSWELAEIMLLPLPVSGCGSSPAGEGGRPLSPSPLPVSGLGSSPAGEGGRPILLSVVVTHKQTCQFMFKGRWHETICFATPKSRLSNSRCRDQRAASRDEMLYLPGDSRPAALRVKPQTAALPNCTQVLPKRNLTGGTRITAARMAVLIGKLQHGHHAQRTRWDPPSLRPPPRCRPA